VFGKVFLDQQSAVVAVALVHELVVDVRQRNTGQRITRAQMHPGLDSAVLRVFGFEPGRGLDLDDAPGVIAIFRNGQKNVLAHQHTLVLQRGLENRRSKHRVHQVRRLAERAGEVTSVVLDERAAILAIKLDGHLANLVAECKGRLGCFGILGQFFAVYLEMHPLLALQRGHDAGFGKAGHTLNIHLNYGVRVKGQSKSSGQALCLWTNFLLCPFTLTP